MSRLQKKCFIASAGTHLLLLLVLFLGPAFLLSDKALDLPPLDVIPWKTVDALVSGGGNPNARPPPAVPTPPTPAPAPPVAQPAPPPKPEPPKVTKPDDESLEAKPTKPKKPEISTRLITRKPEATTKPTAPDPRAKEEAEARQQLASQIGRSASSIRTKASSSTSIDTNYGPGGGGEAYANYAQVVKAIYEQAWIPPDDTETDDAITKVTVTIARDGTVVIANITRPSGDAAVDRSVQATLHRVTFIRPFPEGSTDKQRTYNINFNLKAKRLLG